MPFRITHSSNNPNFIDFGTWINAKKSQAQQANDTAEVQKIQAALDAKEDANAGRNTGQTTMDASNGAISEVNVRDELSVGVPEFDFYWNQWATEFGVTVNIEDI